MKHFTERNIPVQRLSNTVVPSFNVLFNTLPIASSITKKQTIPPWCQECGPHDSLTRRKPGHTTRLIILPTCEAQPLRLISTCSHRATGCSVSITSVREESDILVFSHQTEVCDTVHPSAVVAFSQHPSSQRSLCSWPIRTYMHVTLRHLDANRPDLHSTLEVDYDFDAIRCTCSTISKS